MVLDSTGETEEEGGRGRPSVRIIVCVRMIAWSSNHVGFLQATKHYFFKSNSI